MNWKEFQKTNEILFNLFQTSLDFLILLDCDNFIIETFNENFSNFLGEKKNIIHKRDIFAQDLIFSQNQKELINNFLNSPLRTHPIEVNIYNSVGKNILCQLSFFPVNLDNNNYILLILHDKSDYNKIETSLRKSEKRYRKIIEQLPFPLVMSDNLDNNLYVNPAFTNLLGYTVEDIATTQEWADRAYPDDNYRKTRLENAPEITDEISQGRINHVRCKNGKMRDIIFRDVSVSENEFITIFEDVTEKIKAETDQKKSEVRFQKIVELIPYPVGITDLSRNTIYINSTFHEIFGYTLEDIPTEMEWIKKAYPDEKYRQQIPLNADYGEEGFSKKRERKITCKDGTFKYVILRDVLINDEIEVTIGEDITDRKKAEQKLLESEQKFREVLDHSIDVPYKYNCITQKYEYISPSIEKVYGFSQTDIIEGNESFINQLVFPEDISKFRFQEAPINVDPRLQIPHSIQYRVITKQGKIKWVGDNHTVFRNQKGESEYIIGVIRDITDLIHTEEIIREQKKEFQEIVENASDLIIRLNIKENITSINPICKEMLGYYPEEMLNHNLYEFIPKEYLPIINQKTQLKIEGKAEQTIYDIEFITKNNERLEIEINSRLISRNGNLIGYQVIGRDITKRKKINEELIRQQKIESIALLAGGIAHDYNNILVAILGNINLLQLEDLTSDQMEILQDLEKGTLRARDLTKQLLSFSKGGIIHKKGVNIKELIEESATFVLRGSKCKCVFDFEENLPPVEIDASQINQVINNLVINADQAMSQGGIIHISAKSIYISEDNIIPVKPGRYIKVSIRDSGEGIPRKIRHKMFEPYFTTKSTGNGLGLASCYSIIKKHDGYITFSSKEEEGTTFKIYLPTTDKFDMNQDVTSKLKFQPKGSVILFDDDLNIHKFLARFFVKYDITMESAYSHQEFFDKFSDHFASGNRFSLVIMDLTIPGGKGAKDIIHDLREVDQNVVVIVSSGYLNDSIMIHYKEFGFDATLTKPYTITQLESLLSNYFQ